MNLGISRYESADDTIVQLHRFPNLWLNGNYARGQVTKMTSFQTQIRPLFTERDIQHMSKVFNLGSHDVVKAYAGVIYDRIRGISAGRNAAATTREKALRSNLAFNSSQGEWRMSLHHSRHKGRTILLG